MGVNDVERLLGRGDDCIQRFEKLVYCTRTERLLSTDWNAEFKVGDCAMQRSEYFCHMPTSRGSKTAKEVA